MIALHEGDCRAVLAALPAESVDCVIADPPYGDTSLAWDRRVDGWLWACFRVMKPSASLWCFGSMRFFMETIGDFRDWNMAQEVVWEKHNGSGFAADRFRRVHELAVQFYHSAHSWGDIYKDPQLDPKRQKIGGGVKNRTSTPHLGSIGSSVNYDEGRDRMMTSVIYARSCHGSAIHPTQKPIEILLPLIRYSCPPGGLVLDPFAGSGSTLIAAKIAGRNAVGVEKDPEHVASARARITADAPLFTEVA